MGERKSHNHVRFTGLADWERELLYGEDNRMGRLSDGIHARIRELSDEITASHRMIGEAFVAGDNELAEDWAVSVRQLTVRVDELQGVLRLMGE